MKSLPIGIQTERVQSVPGLPVSAQDDFSYSIHRAVRKWVDDGLVGAVGSAHLDNALVSRWYHTNGDIHRQKYLITLGKFLEGLSKGDSKIRLTKYDDRKTQLAAFEFESGGKLQSVFVKADRPYLPGSNEAKLTISIRPYNGKQLSQYYRELRVGSDVEKLRTPHLDITDVQYVDNNRKRYQNWETGNHRDLSLVFNSDEGHSMNRFATLFFEKYVEPKVEKPPTRAERHGKQLFIHPELGPVYKG